MKTKIKKHHVYKFIGYKDLWKETLNEYDFALLEKQYEI